MIELLDELMKCFSTALEGISKPEIEIQPPVSKEDDEAELEPIYPETVYSLYTPRVDSVDLDEVPF